MKRTRKNKEQRGKKGRKARETRAWNQVEKATAAYYASLSGDALAEENRLGTAFGWAASHVNFDE